MKFSRMDICKPLLYYKASLEAHHTDFVAELGTLVVAVLFDFITKYTVKKTFSL